MSALSSDATCRVAAVRNGFSVAARQLAGAAFRFDFAVCRFDCVASAGGNVSLPVGGVSWCIGGDAFRIADAIF